MGWSLDERNEDIMERRVGQLAGLLGFVLVMGRLGRLLLSGDDHLQWRLILLASAILGGVVWWLLNQVTSLRWVAITGFSLAGLILFLRVSVPNTLAAGVLPTAETWNALTIEMSDAFGWIRSGVPPITPTDGIVAILVLVVWVVGALYVWGLTGGPVAAMVLPTMILYLQFSVFDRAEAGITWLVLSATMLGLGITAIGLERKRDAGRARDDQGRPKPRRSMAVSLTMAAIIGVIAVGVSTSASTAVSEYGNYPWRTGDGLFGGASGGGNFDAFVGLRQQLLKPTAEVMFQAEVGDDSPPLSELYWTMGVLDEFDGTLWKRSSDQISQIRGYDEDEAIGNPDHRYQGTTANVLQNVVIDGLKGFLVPSIGGVEEVHSLPNDRAIQPSEFDVTPAATLLYQPKIARGDTYQVLAQYALHRGDVGALATMDNGRLSPIFAGAAEDGLFDADPGETPGSILQPEDIEFYTRLPEDNSGSIGGIARARTRGAVTNYERAFLLQSWFRDSGNFEYSLDVTTGSGALVLEEWLGNPQSPNYRKGYCEQFAASMAVLGRSLGIPSRVIWGFTPGEVVNDDLIVVKNQNAHAWVEMWMDGFGWVSFDPTPRGEFQPESITAGFTPADYLPEAASTDNLPLPDLDLTPEIPFEDNPPGFDPVSSGSSTWIFAVLGLVLLMFVPPAVKWQRRRRRIMQLQDGDITAAWEELVDRLTDLGEGVPAELTPVEYAGLKDPALLPLAMGYSANIYGGQTDNGSESHMYAVDGFVDNAFDTFDRTRATLNPRSLFKRN